MNRKDYILFDLDGTLTDPKEGITKSVQHALEHFGIQTDDLDSLTPFIGPPLRDSFKRYYGFSDEQAWEGVQAYREYFSVRGWVQNKEYPGIKEMLEALKEAGRVLLVATSKPEEFAKKILDHFDMAEYFDFIGGADMGETRVRKADNTAGVLARVAGLFSRRGYNIESLTVGVTADPRYSRMTVVSLGDQTVLEQIKNQLNKLEDVRDIKELQPDRSVYRELMMVKVRANASDRQSVSAISSIFRATIVDVGKDSLTVMLTGDQSKLDALINLLEDYEILELARTGLTGLERGAEDIRMLP